MSGVVDKIFEGDFDEVSEDEYRELVEEAEETLEWNNLDRKDWDSFVAVGDTHGDIDAVQVPVERAVQDGLPIVFLGDYVDRGETQLENLAYILDLKLERPDKVVLLRGNHETSMMNQRYGFVRALQRRFSMDLYDSVKRIYEKLSVAAVMNGEYFLAHGGIPEGIDNVDEIEELDHSDETYKEIFWNDPTDQVGTFEMNYMRGGYKLYGRKAVRQFLEKNDLKMIIRAHQCFGEGYQYFFDEKVLSIFSVPDYCGNPRGKFALVDKEDIHLIDI